MHLLVLYNVPSDRTVMYHLGQTPQLHQSLLVDARKRWEGFLRTNASLEDEEIKTLLEKKLGKKGLVQYEEVQPLPA